MRPGRAVCSSARGANIRPVNLAETPVISASHIHVGVVQYSVDLVLALGP